MKGLYILLVLTQVLLLGCQLSDSEGDADTTEQLVTIPGGTITMPAKIEVTGNHSISADQFYNYFTFTASEGDEVYIEVVLFDLLSTRDYASCVGTGSGWHISISDHATTCGRSLKYSIPANGDYLVRINYASHNTGYFNLAINPPTVSANEIDLGRPDKPKEISFSSTNIINLNNFYNYYILPARKSDQLVGSVTLDEPMDAQWRARCSANMGSPYPGFKIDELAVSCTGNLDYTFREDNNYLIKVGFEGSNSSYYTGNSGYFNAALVPTTNKLFRDNLIAQPNTEIMSSNLVIQEDNTYVSVDNGTIVQNNVNIAGQNTTANRFDIINIKLLSNVSLGNSEIANVVVGDKSDSWLVNTKVQDYETIDVGNHSGSGVTYYYLDSAIKETSSFRFSGSGSGVAKLYDLDMNEVTPYSTGTSTIGDYYSFKPVEGYYILEVSNGTGAWSLSHSIHLPQY